MLILTFSEIMALKCSGVDGLKPSWVFLLLFARAPLVYFTSWEENGVGSGLYKCSEWGKVRYLGYVRANASAST